MRGYAKLVIIFLIFFITINLEINKVTPPTFSYFFCGLLIIFGAIASRRHDSKYVKTMFATTIAVQIVFCLAIPYWILNRSMMLNTGWPYFPEILWTTGTLVFWYYALSFALIPAAVYLYGRRAWCSFACGTGALAEIVGDGYRKAGTKAAAIPPGFTAFKWLILIVTVLATIYALSGRAGDKSFQIFFLIVFILFLRTLLNQAVNIIFMPRLGTRIWCKYFCPQGLLLGLISSIGRFALVKDEKLCAQCGTCNSN